MKKLWEKIKEALCGIWVFLLLFGIPLILCVVIGLIRIWDDIPKILENITNIGNGSLLNGVFLSLFALVGLINAVIAFLLWGKAFIEILDKKAKSSFGIWFPIIIVSLGWIALIVVLIKIL